VPYAPGLIESGELGGLQSEWRELIWWSAGSCPAGILSCPFLFIFNSDTLGVI
jgi:hypothetical protein